MIVYNAINDDTGSIFISGFVDEKMNFKACIVPESCKVLQVITKDIKALSSLGISSWMSFFDALRDKGVKLVFSECSDLVIRQGTLLIRGFIYPHEIIDLALPYYCEDCDQETKVFKSTKELESIKFNPPKINCPKCGSKSCEFDDEADVYFQNFLAK